jgi:RNA polymerase sigma-70 factor (ECF subfamily)
MAYDSNQAIREARDGDRDALERLFDTHWLPAWRIAYSVTASRALADDAAQAGLIRAFGRLGQYDSDRPFEPWLHRIIVNTAIDLIRQEHRHRRPVEQTVRGTDDIDDDLWELIRELPLDQRTVIVLRYFFDYPIEGIAQIVGVPVGTIQSRIHRALAKLKTALEATNV